MLCPGLSMNMANKKKQLPSCCFEGFSWWQLCLDRCENGSIAW